MIYDLKKGEAAAQFKMLFITIWCYSALNEELIIVEKEPTINIIFS